MVKFPKRENKKVHHHVIVRGEGEGEDEGSDIEGERYGTEICA